jgi:LmbE family N-acetylglucosaminyl deacetylase
MSRTLCSKETILHACVPVSAVDVPVACQPSRLAQSSGCERHDARLYRDKGKDTMGPSETDPNAAPSEPSAAIDAEAVQVARDAADTSDEPSGPKKIAVVVAHPDDAEFICAGTIARWVDEGHEVVYVLLTSGDKGSADPEMTPQKLAATREAEQREAARILGARDVIFMRYPDGELEPNLELRREIVRIIRRLKPDVVGCQDPTVRWVDTQYINHPDHRAAGEATLAAVFPAARDRMNFPELLAEGLEPHKVREIYLAGALTPDVAIDVTAYMERKLESLRAHVSQIGDWDPEPMVREWAKETAERHPGSGDYVESFKYFKLD